MIQKRDAFNLPIWGFPSGKSDTWDIGSNPSVSKNLKRFIKGGIGEGY